LQRLSPSARAWLNQENITGTRVNKSLAHAGQEVIETINRFQGQQGFGRVVREFTAGGAKQEGARFVMQFANANLRDAKTITFEMGTMYTPAGRPGRQVDIVAYGIKYELKSVSEIRSYIVSTGKGKEIGQLPRDFAENIDRLLEGEENFKWVFDGNKLKANGLDKEAVVQELSRLLSRSFLFKDYPLLNRLTAALRHIVVVWPPI
jgi:hypothetical protein